MMLQRQVLDNVATGKTEARFQSKWFLLPAAIPASVGMCWFHSVSCNQQPECDTMRQAMPRDYHGFIAVALGMLFAREVLGLASMLHELLDSRRIWRSALPSFLPALMLCAVLATSALLEFVRTNLVCLWSHAMPRVHMFNDQATLWRPVHTLQSLEWSLDAPCLLVLLGHCVLARPLADVLRPVIMVNSSILLAWAAAVTPGEAMLNRALLLASLLALGSAVGTVAMWAWSYLKASGNVNGKYVRIFIVGAVSAAITSNAATWFLAILGVVDHVSDQFFYSCSALGLKAFLAASFPVLRWAEECQTVTSIMSKAGEVNTTLLSIMNSHFDMVVLGTLDESGSCLLSSIGTNGCRDLERLLGRPVAGLPFENLISSKDTRRHFTVCTQNIVRQARDAGLSRACDHRLPLRSTELNTVSHAAPSTAQVLHCGLRCGLTATGPVLRVKVHVSPLQSDMGNSSYCKEVLVAIALDDQAESSEEDDQESQRKTVPMTNALVEELLDAPSPSESTNAHDFNMDEAFGGSDVGSQSSKVTYVGSVHMACQQLLGSLLEKPPPAELMSRRPEDHVDVASHLVRLQAPAAIARYHHEQELAEWTQRCTNFAANTLLQALPPGNGDRESEDIVEPGPRPSTPTQFAADEVLWRRAWARAYNQDESEYEESDEEDMIETPS